MENASVHIDSYAKYYIHRVKFFLLLSFEVPAYFLSLLIFVFFLKNPRISHISHNQALFILLIVNFIQLSVTLPLNLHFYAIGTVNPATPKFCQWWIFIEFTLYSVSEYLMATISVQRHMLVFNGQMMRIQWMRLVLHHIPLVLCLIYPTTFYLSAIIFYPCDGSQYNYRSNLCGFVPCYLRYNAVLGTYDWTVNNGVPMVINAVANILLIVRVIEQKRHQNRAITWKQQRRMTLQLFCISSLYLVAWSPCLIVGFIQALGLPTFLEQLQTDVFLDLIYLVCLFLPWISLGLLPELLPWLKALIYRRVVVNMMSTTMANRTRINQVHP